MHKDIRFSAIISWIRHPGFLLFFWSGTGLVFGTLLAVSADASCRCLMLLAVSGRLSIVCHIAMQLIPFLIAAYAVYISQYWILYSVCCLKLFSFACIGSLIFLAFGSAGWLVRSLFLFSDIILVPFLLWFLFRQIMDKNALMRRDFWICIGAVAVTVMINWLFISPFLARIIDI